VDSIKIDLREIGWDDTDWINLAQDRDLREIGWDDTDWINLAHDRDHLF
jgi:hypothetical protein